MNIKEMIRTFWWKPTGFVPSLESLDGVNVRCDVTMAVSGTNDGYPLTVAELAGGKMIGDLRMVATAGNVVVGGLQSLLGCSDPQNHYLVHRRRFRMLKRRQGTALLLGAANSDNYYHWLLDSVPRWKMLQAANWGSNFDFVLLHSRSVAFQDEVLDRLNVPREKRLRCSKRFVHQFERLVVPSMPFPPEQITPWACSYVRSLFPERGHGPKKIYLRRGPGRRRLVNERELEAALEKSGFVSIDPQRLTVLEQAKLLSSAKCVVGPHGAAMTNLIFAPPGALLVELFHPDHKNRCYINLAAACGHRYASLDGQAIPASGDRTLEYTVDVPAILQLTREFA